MLKEFCTNISNHFLTNPQNSTRTIESATEDVRNALDMRNYNKCNSVNVRTGKISVYEIIDAILNDRTRSSRNPIKRLWNKVEFKFGRGIKYVLLLSIFIAYALLGGLLIYQFEAPAELEHDAELDQKSMERHKIYVRKISNILTSPQCQSALKTSNVRRNFKGQRMNSIICPLNL